uniref:Uncharacterized protein n=1 Tax=Salarias fasciatus TaxID=181472 RepID=A0A672G3M5_SALFA
MLSPPSLFTGSSKPGWTCPCVVLWDLPGSCLWISERLFQDVSVTGCRLNSALLGFLPDFLESGSSAGTNSELGQPPCHRRKRNQHSLELLVEPEWSRFSQQP